MGDDRAWAALVKADELVQGFGERGWIASETLEVVRARTADVARRSGRAEGAPATDDRSLRGDVDELTALLVALADAAVEAQPDLAPDVPVPVTLADAQDRLGRTHDAYDELG